MCQIYRCWIVYAKFTMIIVIPIILWLASTTCGIAAVGIISGLHTTLYITSPQIKSLFIACSILIAVQNILTTCLWFIRPAFPLLIPLTALIVHRIWIIDRATSDKSHSPLRRVIRIIIESGMMYTITVFLCFGFIVTSSTAVYIAAQIVCLMRFFLIL